MKIIRPGSPVYIKPVTDAQPSEMMAGTVMQACIMPNNHVNYEVRHFMAGTPQRNWYESFELLLPTNVKQYTIGFK
jgi:hypothetical protein